jgi:hypothetical protein
MKKIFILVLVIFIYVIFPSSVFSEVCCDSLYITVGQTDSCCIEVTLHNPRCNNAVVKFLQWNSATNAFELQYSVGVQQGASVAYIFCPMNKDSFIKYRLQVVQSWNQNHPMCTDNPIFMEDYNQFTDSVDVSSCCVCPTNVGDWLTLIVEKDETNCPDGCKVTPILDIPDSITCYKYYSLATSPNFDFTPIKPISQLSSEWKCIGYGETIEFDIALLQSNNVDVENEWDNLCTIEKVSGMCVSDDPQPCKPDCEESNWMMPPETLQVALDNGCSIDIIYTWRRACVPISRQEIQILKILSYNCFGKTFKEIYQKAIYNVIKVNKMGFKPMTGDTNCYDTWRVVGAACSKYLTVQDTAGLFHFELVRCDDSVCCSQKIKVCRLENDEVTITPIGDIISNLDSNCYVMPDSLLTIPPLFPDNICFATCDWIRFGEQNYISGKMSIHLNNKKQKLMCKFVNNRNKLGFIIMCGSDDDCKITIQIFDIYGRQIKEINNRNMNKSKFIDINSLIKQKGVYLYTVHIDKKLIERGKFIK